MGAPERPNVLVVLTDQQRWDTVGAYGSPMALTPCLDRLAAEGTLLEYCFSNQPLCAPARGCLQTGQYATTHGVWRNNIALVPKGPTLADAFRGAGYEVGYIGKWHLANTRTAPCPPETRGGYVDHWEAADILEFTSKPYGGYVYDKEDRRVELEGYRVDALTDLAVRFLSARRERPFFLFLSYVEPHHQNDMERFVAPDGYRERYANPWVPGDLLGRPGDWYASLPDYYGMIARIDECLARLVAALEAAGKQEETIILFTSDHGCHFRTRNREYKRSCHEASVRVPAVLWGPGVRPGHTVRNLVGLVDLPPTLLDACGIEIPSSMQGRSMMPLIRGSSRDWLDEVFVQISEAEVGRALRTRRWKYGVFAPDQKGSAVPAAERYVERYLYDLYADPHEQVNLVGRHDMVAVAEHLRARLAWHIERVEGAAPLIEAAAYPA